MTKLYKYQRRGVRLLDYFDGRALLSDEMGLGKSIQALWYAHNFLDPKAKIVVICPASVKIHWQREASRHCNIRAEVLDGLHPRGETIPSSRMLILNYDILPGRKGQQTTWLNLLYNLRPDLVIVDECHFIKSPEAKRSKAVALLCSIAPRVIMISGTPLTNRPAELYNALKILHPNEFPSRTAYYWRYCNPKVTPWGLDVTGASNLDELHQRLTDLCMIRRKKCDVLKDLPAKTRSVIPMELTPAAKKEYNRCEKEFVQWLWKISPDKARAAENAEYLVKRGYLRRLAGMLKQKSVIEWIENFMEESDEKLIFFGIHKAFLKPIYEHFKPIAVLVDGSVTGKHRQLAFDGFTNVAKKRLLVGNIQAAGLGWNGQVASNVAFGELAEVPGEMTQAEDRPHRIGQKKGVICHYLVSQGTIEEQLCQILQEKQRTLTHVLDGKNSIELDIMTRLDNAMLTKYGYKVKK